MTIFFDNKNSYFTLIWQDFLENIDIEIYFTCTGRSAIIITSNLRLLRPVYIHWALPQWLRIQLEPQPSQRLIPAAATASASGLPSTIRINWNIRIQMPLQKASSFCASLVLNLGAQLVSHKATGIFTVNDPWKQLMDSRQSRFHYSIFNNLTFQAAPTGKKHIRLPLLHK